MTSPKAWASALLTVVAFVALCWGAWGHAGLVGGAVFSAVVFAVAYALTALRRSRVKKED